jgi:hypothetical protein
MELGQQYLITFLFTYSMVQDILWKADSHSACQTTAFMEPEDSLTCSQKSTTGSYPEPAESSSPQQSLSSHLRLGLPSSLLPSGLPTKTL